MIDRWRSFEDWYEQDQETRLSSRTARVASRSGTHLSEYTERWVPALASLGRDDNSQESLLLKDGLRRVAHRLVFPELPGAVGILRLRPPGIGKLAVGQELHAAKERRLHLLARIGLGNDGMT